MKACVEHDVKLPWFVDLLNLNLGNDDLAEARRRLQTFLEAFRKGERVTANVDFEAGEPSRRQLIREEADGDDVSSASPRPHRRRHSAVANAGDARA